MAYQLRNTNLLDVHVGQLYVEGMDLNGNLIAPIVTTSNVLCENVYVQRAVECDNCGNIQGDLIVNGNITSTGIISSSGNDYGFTSTEKTAGTTTMTADATYYQRFFGTTTHSVELPTLASAGQTYVFINEGGVGDSLTIKSANGTTVTTLSNGNERATVLGWDLTSPTAGSSWTVLFNFP